MKPDSLSFRFNSAFRAFAALLFLLVLFQPRAVLSAAVVDLSGYNATGAIAVTNPDSNTLRAGWTDKTGVRFQATFNLTSGQPLLRSLETAPSAGGTLATLAQNVDPRYRVTLGNRVQKTSWPYVFFERIDENSPAPVPYFSSLDMTSARVVSESTNRLKIVFSTLKVNTYQGELACYIYSGSPLIQFQASMTVTDPWVSYIVDALFYSDFASISYRDGNDAFQTRTNAVITATAPGDTASIGAKHRTMMATFAGGGTLAAVAAPHTAIYPTDFSNNFGTLQAGKTFFGTRMSPSADSRYRPWVNAPEGSTQKMDVFLLISVGTPQQTLDRVLTYTNGDYYKSVPGHYTMGVHFHPEFTAAHLAGGDTITAFKQAMKAVGVQIIQPLEFHGAGHPFANTTDRLAELRDMYSLLQANSDASFVFIPGEEYNNFFGGHWSYMFPKPVYFTGWSGQGTREYKQTNVVSGSVTFPTVYQIGDAARMLQLLRDEGGIAWASHPRVKGSQTTPDSYVNSDFYRDGLFQTGGWKAMPADFSKDRLGFRAFQLMDETAQWGYEKYQVGETDTFGLNSTHDIYAHLNINYIELPAMPSATDWSTVVDSIRHGRFFNSTGEVLIHSWAASATGVTANVEWYFPPAFAEITWGDAGGIHKLKKLLTDLSEFGSGPITVNADLTGANWVRFEFWDVARNGAFTQPLWLAAPANPAVLPGSTSNFTLMDTDTDSPVPGYDPIPTNSVLNRSLLPSNLTIRANVSPLIMDSVTLVLDGVSASRTQWPYCLTLTTTGTGIGDSPSYDLSPASLSGGSHTLTATPFRGTTSGTPLTLVFSVTGTVPPSIPTGLSATASNHQVALNWNAAAGATSYNVKRSNNSGGPYAYLDTTSSTNYTDSALTNGVPWYYVVSSVAGSESANSQQASATPSNDISIIEHFTEGVAAVADVPIGTAPGWHAIAKSAAGVVTDYTSSIPAAKNSPNIADNTAGADGTTGYFVVGLSTVVNPILTWVDTSASLHNAALRSVTFFSRNGAAGSAVRVAIQIGGKWYVSTQTFTDSGGNSVWVQQNFTFSPSASAWRALEPATLVLGNTLTAFPDGDVTAVGLFAQVASEKVRVDEFKIVASPFSPFQVWQIKNYGSLNAPASAPDISPANDGVTNRMRYALNIPPAEPPLPYLPAVQKIVAGGVEYLSITYTARRATADVSYVVEVADELGNWKSGPLFTTLVSTIPRDLETDTVVVRDNVAIAADDRRFIRLHATVVTD